MKTSLTSILLELLVPRKRTPRQIVGYIKDITPEKENIPHHFLKMILNSKKMFELKEVNVEEVLKNDPNAMEYVESGEERYDDDDMNQNDLENPIVILDNTVLDGYSRLAYHYRTGKKQIEAYVA